MTSRVRGGIWAISIAALAYATIFGATCIVERRQIYKPGPDRTLVVPRTELGMPIERVKILTRDSIVLVGWVIAGERIPAVDSTTWILICHGSGGNIAAPSRLQHYAALRHIGLNIFAFDYRGYGESAGKPTEEGLYRDGDAAYNYLREVRGVPASRIILFGHSLGSAIAVDLAARVPAAGLIVEGAFTSMTDHAQELYPWAPVRWLPVSHFASIDKIAQVGVPKLFLHATADQVIPIVHSHYLYAKAEGKKQFVELRGGHKDAFKADSAKYFGAIARFASEVTGMSFHSDP